MESNILVYPLAQAHKENDSLPEILRIIKDNYKILISFGPLEGDSMWHVEQRKLKSMGFNFKFFTSTGKHFNDEFRYCFERGWCNAGDEFINIKDDPFQADTSR